VTRELTDHSIAELSSLIRSRTVSPVELTDAVLERIDRHDDTLRAYISVYREEAAARAKEAEQEITAGRWRGPLHGIPLGIKDNLYVAGRVTTMGSTIHRDFVPEDTATVVSRLTDAGAVVLGKLNLHEYALGGTTDNRVFGTCRNPWRLDRSPGGSSGGSAVSVATGLALGALGSDTSGSIRVPASLCGIVGLKPTYGRVSKYGCFPEAWTLDHVGPMTRTVTDAAILLDAISGFDPRDPASVDLPPTTTVGGLSADCTGVVLGVDEKYFFHDVDPEIEAVVRAAIAGLERAGAVVRPVEVRGLRHGDHALTVIDTAEASTVHHANLRDRPQDFADDVRLLLECGELPSAVEYLQAQQLRRRLRQEMQLVFDEVDLLVAPMVPVPTPTIGGSGAGVFSVVTPASLLGLPSLSVPCGLVDGMPVGLQIIGPALADQRVLDTGRAVEELGLLGSAGPTAHLDRE
jgi:aspartyl-tRNA(Asn)/glutamyl-tRNA(Gln) amidotransferase subunit A